MRFGDGAWRMLDDVTPHALRRVDETEVSERRALLHVSSQQDLSRGATLSGHMFTVTVTSPLDNVIRVRVTHHRGRKQRSLKQRARRLAEGIDIDDGLYRELLAL
jgi:alpha-D-xyloside xylohydrolase